MFTVYNIFYIACLPEEVCCGTLRGGLDAGTGAGAGAGGVAVAAVMAVAATRARGTAPGDTAALPPLPPPPPANVVMLV